MNYIYLILGIILGIVFLGRAKNAKNKKFIPYEAKMKLKSKKTIDQYDEWCKKEALGCRLVGIGFILFGLSATFMDSSVAVGNVISIASLVIFVIGFIMRIINNKKHLGHYFTK
ncbi:MAG: hypothetical protein E7479_09200 [Ruminococcaceae bacterium]|nr:hypothetical protein [Oscillospiraceae bacterium]